MNEKARADQVIQSHVMGSMAAGLVPVPLLDLAAVAGVQVAMLKKLGKIYGVSYSENTYEQLVTALTGSTFAKVGASFVKAIPVVGSVLGGVSMVALSGASTYAVGQVVLQQLEEHRDLAKVDISAAKAAYEAAFEQGKKVAASVDRDDVKRHKDVLRSLERLANLKEQGVITDAEFAAQKAKLLSKL